MAVQNLLTTARPPGSQIYTINSSTGDPELAVSVSSLGLTTSTTGPLTPAPVINGGNIFLDPSNSTGVASDSNPGTQFLPLLTWAGLVALWGSRTPVFNTPTTVNIISSMLATDPIILDPIITGTGTFVILGSGGVNTAVAISGVVPKSRALGSNTMLQANLGQAVTVGTLLINNTTGGIGWAYKLVSGTTWNIAQPMANVGIGGVLAPAEDNAWANGNNVQSGAVQSTIILAQLAPTVLNTPNAGSSTYPVQVIQANLAGGNIGFVGRNVQFSQCQIQQTLKMVGGGNQPSGDAVVFTNCAFFGANAGLSTEANSVCTFNGGMISSTIGANNLVCGSNGFWVLDGDMAIGQKIVAFSGAQLIGDVGIGFGPCFVDGVVLEMTKGKAANYSYGNAVLYGTAGGNINIRGQGRFTNSTGQTAVATFTAPTMATNIQLNAQSTGSSISGTTRATINSGITLSPTNIDAAAGATGFGSTAFRPGGASYSNQS